jgi:hypothetical protein
LNNKSASDVAPGSPGSGWISLRSAIGAGTGSSNLALSDLSVGSDAAASGGGGLAYNNSSGVFTYTPPVLTSFLTSSDISTFIALGDISVGSDAAASGSGGLSYNNSSGVFTFTPPVLSSFLTSSDISTFIALGDISVGSDAAASGSGGLAYNNSSGVFTYTPPSLSSFLTSSDISTFIALGDISVGSPAAASGSGGLAYNNSSGVFTYTPPSLTSFLTSSDISTFIALGDISVGSNAAASGSGGLAYNNSSGVFTYTPPNLSTFLTSSDLSGYAALSGATFTGAISGTSLTLSGNLTVAGTVTQSNSQEVNFNDTRLRLNIPTDLLDGSIENVGAPATDTNVGIEIFNGSTGGAFSNGPLWVYNYSTDHWGASIQGSVTTLDNVKAFKFNVTTSSLGAEADATNDVADLYATANTARSNNTNVRSVGAVSKCTIDITTDSSDDGSNFAPVAAAANGYPIQHDLDTSSVFVFALKTHQAGVEGTGGVATLIAEPQPIFCKFKVLTAGIVEVSVGITKENEKYDIIVIG